MIDEFQIVRNFLTSLNSAAADDLETLLTITENLKTCLTNEIERTKQAQKEYDELLNRHKETNKLWSLDKDTIRTQRNEIGMKIWQNQF